MDFKVGQKQAYVNNPMLVRNIGQVRSNRYVQNLAALKRYDALDKGYGQRPRVEDDNNASGLLGDKKLREICIA